MRSNLQRHPARIGAGMILAMLVVSAPLASAVEIIPSVGITGAVDSDDNSTKAFGGLALRGQVLPFVSAEIGAMYRQEERLNGALAIRQWPITASLWLNPVPIVYVGGGAGWYSMTFDYDDSLPLSDETVDGPGVHLGGGVRLPLLPRLGLDVNGRYVFLGEFDQKISTERLDPDFWTASVGLALKL
jgi:hypothetical protein